MNVLSAFNCYIAESLNILKEENLRYKPVLEQGYQYWNMCCYNKTISINKTNDIGQQIHFLFIYLENAYNPLDKLWKTLEDLKITSNIVNLM